MKRSHFRILTETSNRMNLHNWLDSETAKRPELDTRRGSEKWKKSNLEKSKCQSNKVIQKFNISSHLTYLTYLTYLTSSLIFSWVSRFCTSCVSFDVLRYKVRARQSTKRTMLDHVRRPQCHSLNLSGSISSMESKQSHLTLSLWILLLLILSLWFERPKLARPKIHAPILSRTQFHRGMSWHKDILLASWDSRIFIELASSFDYFRLQTRIRTIDKTLGSWHHQLSCHRKLCCVDMISLTPGNEPKIQSQYPRCSRIPKGQQTRPTFCV